MWDEKNLPLGKVKVAVFGLSLAVTPVPLNLSGTSMSVGAATFCLCCCPIAGRKTVKRTSTSVPSLAATVEDDPVEIDT